MAEYKILIEGQTIPVPPEIGENDENVKKALAPFFPEAATAMITRTEKDGVITVNVVKRAGSKGNPTLNRSAKLDAGNPLQALRKCREGTNPAVALYLEISQADPSALEAEALLALDKRISKAVEEGKEQGQQMERARRRLKESDALAAPELVAGF